MLGANDDASTTGLPCLGLHLRRAPANYFLVESCSSSSLHDGAHTGWLLPKSLRDFSMARGRCLPHKKHDMVAAPNDEVAAKGEPGALDL
jgi:hypothetical protein